MKSKLVDQLQADCLLGDRHETEALVNQVFAALAKVLERDETVTIRGFGSFRRKFRDTKMVRNPRTGERHTLLAHHVITFKGARK